MRARRRAAGWIAASGLVVVMLATQVGGCAPSDRVAGRPADPVKVTLVSHDRLAYPMDMFKASIQGRVVVDCAIAADGATHDCRIMRSSNAGFDRAALTFARSCVFQATPPGTLPLDHHEWTIAWKIAF